MESEVGPSAGELAVLDDLPEDSTVVPPKDEKPSEEEITEDDVLPEDEDESEEDAETAEDEDKDTDEEKVDEEEETTEEDEPEEDDPKFSAQDDRPSYKDIKAKFPTFFKDFPGARTALFREREFAAVFPTVESAKDAEDRVKFYVNLDREITSGNAEILLKGIADGEKNDSVRTFAENFLPSLEKVDQDIYVETIKPVIINVLQNVLHEATNSKNESLKKAVAWVSNSIFGKAQLPSIEKKTEDPEVTEQKRRLQEREQQIIKTSYDNAYESVSRRCRTKGAELISTDISNLKISSFTKEALQEKIFNETDQMIVRDPAFKKRIDHLWILASQANFDPKLVSRVHQAYLERFKSVMPAIRRTLVAKALGNRKQATNSNGKPDPTKKRVAFTERKEAPKTEPKNTGGIDAQVKALG